jgi:aminoglycoside phosphotransferase (APT) family kinase protein
MSACGPRRYWDALQVACRLARLNPAGAVLLHVRANAVYHLPHSDVIVRIRCARADRDAVLERLTAAVHLTSSLHGQGFPATEPLDIDQPVALNDHVATFWRYLTVANTAKRDLTALGRLIRRLHSLPYPHVSLPSANPLGSLRADLNGSDAITPADRRWLLDRADDLEEQYRRTKWTLGTGLIHGDAHADNLLHTPNGVILGDWDSVSHGPRELDLVPTSMWYRYGRPRAEWDTFCSAYDINPGDLAGLPLLQKLRELHALAAYTRSATGDVLFRAELTRRITSLRVGNHTLPWQAL